MSNGSVTTSVSRHRWWWRIGKSAAALALVALAAAVVLNLTNARSAAVVFGLIIVALIILFAREEHVERVLKRLGKVEFSAAGVKIGAEAVANSSAAISDLGDQETDSVNADLVDIRLKLDHKLAYIAKYLLADYYEDESKPTLTGWDLDPEWRPAYVNVGSLEYDGYLTKEEAATALYVQNLSGFDLKQMPEDERREFLSNAAELVRNIRAKVFRGQVRRALDSITGCVRVCDLHVRQGSLVWTVHYKNRALVVVPVLDVPGGVAPESISFKWKSHGNALVVLPNKSRTKPAKPGPEQRLVRVGDLESGLEAVAGRSEGAEAYG